MKDFDFKGDLRRLYNPPAEQVEIIDVPAMNFIMIDGEGNPDTSRQFGESIGALYTLSFALQFRIKKEIGKDYAIMPLEVLWWAEGMTEFKLAYNGTWMWTLKRGMSNVQ